MLKKSFLSNFIISKRNPNHFKLKVADIIKKALINLNKKCTKICLSEKSNLAKHEYVK